MEEDDGEGMTSSRHNSREIWPEVEQKPFVGCLFVSQYNRRLSTQDGHSWICTSIKEMGWGVAIRFRLSCCSHKLLCQ